MFDDGADDGAGDDDAAADGDDVFDDDDYSIHEWILGIPLLQTNQHAMDALGTVFTWDHSDDVRENLQ